MAMPRRLTTEQIVQSMQNLYENKSDNEGLGGFISDNSSDEDFHPSISSENDSDLDTDNEVTSEDAINCSQQVDINKTTFISHMTPSRRKHNDFTRCEIGRGRELPSSELSMVGNHEYGQDETK